MPDTRSFLSRRSVLAGSGATALTACATGVGGDALMPANTITVDGRTLNYVRGGRGPKLILLHGASGNLMDWTFDLFATLAQSYEVLAFDRPGLGLSDPAATPSLTAQAALMRAAASSLGFATATLVGHSFGGSVALQWAADAPQSVSGLVLASAPSHVWPGSAGRLYDIAKTPVIGYLFSNVVPLIATPRRIDDALAAIFAPQPVPAGYAAHIQPELSLRPETYRNNAAQVGTLKEQLRRLTPLYPAFDMPVELIHGTADKIVPSDIHSEALVRAIPNARLQRLEGIGHMPHHVAPDAFFDAIARAV